MPHTQGTAHVRNGTPAVIHVGTIQVADCFIDNPLPKEECKANAQRLALAWNAHDALLAACKKLVEGGACCCEDWIAGEAPCPFCVGTNAIALAEPHP